MATEAFNFVGPQPQKQAPANPLANTALAYGGPGVIQQVQGNEALADALQTLQESGAQASKTPLALGANLLADALLTWGRNRSNKTLAGQIAQAQASVLNGQPLPGEGAYLASQSGASPGGSPASQGPPPAGSGVAPGVGATPALPETSSPSGAAPAASGANPSGPPPVVTGSTLADALSPASAAPVDPKQEMLAALVAGGASPLAASGLVGNFAQESGPRLDRNNPAEGSIGAAGWEGPRAAAAQAYFDAHGGMTIPNEAAFTLQELKGPEARAFARLNAATDPQSAAAAALAYERPAGWTPNGDPSQASGWPNRLATTQALAASQGPTPGQEASGGIHGGLSVSATPMNNTSQASLNPALQAPIPQDAPGPMGGGPPPQGRPPGIFGPPVPPQAAPGPMPSQQPQGAQGGSIRPEPFPIQPSQFAQLEQLKAAAARQPQLYMQPYMELHQKLMDQASTPEPLEIGRPVNGQIPITGKLSGKFYGWQGAAGGIVDAGPKMASDGRGGFVPVQSTMLQEQPGAAPGVRTAFDPMTGRITDTAIPNAVAAGGTQAWNPQTRSYQPLPGLQPVVSGNYQPGTVTAQKPGESPTVVQAPPYSAQDLIAQRSAYKSGDTYKSYVNTAAALNSLGTILAQATGNNGIVDMSAFDNLIRAQTGLSARQGNMAMMMQHLGFPAEAAGLVSNIAGNGFTTPEQIKSAYQALRGYATTHQAIAQHELDEDAALAKKGGQDFGLTLPTLAPPPNVPWMGSSNPGGAQNPADVIAAARAAIAHGAPRAAVIQRTKAMGVDPSGL